MQAMVRVLLVMAWCAAWPCSTEAELTGDQAALIQDVIRLSGLQDQLDRIPGQMQAQLEARKDELSAEASKRVQAVIAKAFDAKRLHVGAIEMFSQRADTERLQQVAQWLRGPLGSRMTALEVAATRPDAEPALREFMAQLQAAPPSPARLELAKRLSEATDAPDAALRLMTAMVQGMADAFDAARDDGTSASRQEVEAALAQLRSQREIVVQGILVKLLFTYRDASEQELSDYAAFWESDLGRWFNGLSVDAFTTSLTGASTAMAQELAPLAGAPPAGGTAPKTE